MSEAAEKSLDMSAVFYFGRTPVPNTWSSGCLKSKIAKESDKAYFIHGQSPTTVPASAGLLP